MTPIPISTIFVAHTSQEHWVTPKINRCSQFFEKASLTSTSCPNDWQQNIKLLHKSKQDPYLKIYVVFHDFQQNVYISRRMCLLMFPSKRLKKGRGVTTHSAIKAISYVPGIRIHILKQEEHFKYFEVAESIGILIKI